MASLDDELAAIEEAASCCHKLTPQSAVASSSCAETYSDNSDKGGAVGSTHNNEKGSLFSVSEKVDITAMKGVAAASTKAKQRNSVSINAMMPNALAELQDLVDSDSDDEEPSSAPAPHVPNLKASGGPEHRPLVGGFAAAAYEAARVDYYKKKGVTNVNGHVQPQRPPRSYPRYP
mmetsp:Transcript_9475/g.14198  ORF Transcript_9475/g.14198 Transcript_9475/m.14198 type:complete len:176 (-) Transcript_9475:92-619(-)|eukprot:scaffold5994_cov150-Skeletonema_dohrnii-CCMP3373.AAC.10